MSLLPGNLGINHPRRFSLTLPIKAQYQGNEQYEPYENRPLSHSPRTGVGQMVAMKYSMKP